MQILFWAFIGGVAGAFLMDISESLWARCGITSGVTSALIGRWFLHLMQGKFRHVDILESKPLTNEIIAGLAFHYLVGGGVVALFYPFSFIFLDLKIPQHHLLPGLVYGLTTSLLSWFILLPAFGWGMCGRSGPPHSNALLASPLAHLPYGLGMGIVLTVSQLR